MPVAGMHGGTPYQQQMPEDPIFSDTYYLWGNPEQGISIGVDYGADTGFDWRHTDRVGYIPKFLDSNAFSGSSVFVQAMGKPVPLVEAYANGDYGLMPCASPNRVDASVCKGQTS